jgi:glycerol-3-phosphate dehydrogenase
VGPRALAVVGGGATGPGRGARRRARGLRVALVEAEDFAKGTSSRATKLVHGGVRYLAQGTSAWCARRLHERSTVLANAPHLAQRLPFVMPATGWWDRRSTASG